MNAAISAVSAAIPASEPSRPVAESDRLMAMDIARGFALLGIFMVNIQTFAEPFGRFMAPTPEPGGALTTLCFYLERIFCEGKFYPLFSMLFGMGMMLQMASVDSRGGRFVPLYLRRLFVLMVIGFLHATLLWYGDILFTYSICGLILFLCRRASGRTLLIAGIIMVGASTLLGGAFGAMGALGNHRPAPVASVAESSEPVDSDDAVAPAQTAESSKEVELNDFDRLAQTSPFVRWLQAYQRGEIKGGPDDPLYMELETRAYREGGFWDAMGFRVSTWLFFLVFLFFGMGWHIAGMFFIGAAFIKFGLLGPGGAAWRARLLVIGLLVGLPGSVIAAFVPHAGLGFLGAAVMVMLGFACGPLLSILYLMLAARLAESGRALALASTLASTGRMALTNYLMQTIVSTAVFYWWGFAQFGLWTRPERCAFVLAVFAAQCVFSVLWMRRFRFGPMEWLWRSLTYLKREPMLR